MKMEVSFEMTDLLLGNFTNQLKTGYQLDMVDLSVPPIISLHKTRIDNVNEYSLLMSTMCKLDGRILTLKTPLVYSYNGDVNDDFNLVWERYKALTSNNSPFLSRICDILKSFGVQTIQVRTNIESIKRPEFQTINL